MLKYIVDEEYYPMEFPEDERNTALSIAEVLANKGRNVTVRIQKDKEKKELVEVVRCANCKLYKCHINSSGRLVQECEEGMVGVHGDFWCALGQLNRKDEV